MKKIATLIFVALLLFSCRPTVLAAELICDSCGTLSVCEQCNNCVVCDNCVCEDVRINEWSKGTLVIVEATNIEPYTITVPAKLSPGQSGTVTLSGLWPSYKMISIVANESVTLINNLLKTDTKNLKITFGGIYKTGNDIESQTFTAPVSVEAISNALFGVWSGHFNYTVDVSGSLNPDDGTTPVNGEFYYAGDYVYMYGFSGWTVFINMEGTDKTKTSYGAILESINGEPVVNLDGTFFECSNLIVAPKIPASIVDMKGAFSGCASLVTAPALPVGLRNMDSAFYGCTALTTVSQIPSSVTDMDSTFYNCVNLTGNLEINNNPTNIFSCFYGVDFEAQNLTLTGSSANLDKLGATGINYCNVCNGKCQGSH